MVESKFVDETTLIGELVSQYPETTDVLLGIGMHCLGCPRPPGAGPPFVLRWRDRYRSA